jgi:chitosanase
MTPELKARIKQVVNAFEMGTKEIRYSDIYIYRDGPNDIRQITLSVGFTEYGNLKQVVQQYVNDGGKYAEDFKPYLPKIGRTALVDNAAFKNLLIKSSKEDPIMRAAQDKIYDQKYWDKAYEWFLDNDFKEPLSMMVIMDSFIHSGSILGFLRNRFNESVPVNGGNEKEWIKQYVSARRSWLANHSRKVLRNTVYRMDFMQYQMKRNNWAFNCPITAHGVKIC